MRTDEFRRELLYLSDAVGKTITESQKEIYFDRFKTWSQKKFRRVSDLCINEYEGRNFPSIATLLRLGRDIPDEQSPEREKVSCKLCYGDGVITAKKNGYNTTFRCSECQNWQGRYSESIPAYTSRYLRDGYKLEDHQVGEDQMDPNDELQAKGMKLLMEAAPNLAKKILAKHPGFREKLEGVKSQVQFSGLKPREDQEATRQRQLKQDREREVLSGSFEAPGNRRTH